MGAEASRQEVLPRAVDGAAGRSRAQEGPAERKISPSPFHCPFDPATAEGEKVAQMIEWPMNVLRETQCGVNHTTKYTKLECTN